MQLGKAMNAEAERAEFIVKLQEELRATRRAHAKAAAAAAADI